MRHCLTAISMCLAASAGAAEWRCSNNFESQCLAGACSVETVQGSFTPLDIRFDDTGYVEVCAYSGCWRGKGKVIARAPFLTLVGEDVPWSMPAPNDSVNIVISLNAKERVGTLQAGGFVQPFSCPPP
jgi:hypothetical protein